jgi:hypothetical protein
MISVDIMTPSLKIDTQLSQMRLQLLTTSPNKLSLKVFVEKITEMIKNLEAEQAKHEAVNKNMTKQCGEEEKFRKIEIVDAQAAYTASSGAEVKCSASLAEAKKFLPDLERTVTDYKAQIKVKTAERDVQHKKYLESQKEWESAIAFLKSFLKKIDATIQGGNKATLVELNEQLIRHVAKLGRLEKLVPIFVELEGDVNTDSSFGSSSSGDDSEEDDDEDDEGEVVGKNVTNSTKSIKKSHSLVSKSAKKSKNSTTSRTKTKNVTSLAPKITSIEQLVSKVANRTNNTTVHATSLKNVATISSFTNKTNSTNSTQFKIPNSTVVKSLSDKKLNHLEKIVGDLVNQLVADSNAADLEEVNLEKSFEKLILEFNTIIVQLNQNILRIKAQITEMNLCVKKEQVVMDTAASKKLRNEKMLAIADKTCVDFVKDFVIATKNRYREVESVKDILTIIKKRFGQFPQSLLKLLDQLGGEFKKYINTTQFQKYDGIAQSHIQDNAHGRSLSKN